MPLILLIVLMKTYINCNLWGYEQSLNQTSTTCQFILPHLTTTTFALASSAPSQLHATTPPGAPPLS